MIHRTAFDWKGIICGHVTKEYLNACPCPIDEEDGESEGNGHNDHYDGQVSSSRNQRRKTPEEIELKSRREARMKEVQDHFYRIKAKLESCKMADFWEKADGVDGHLLNVPKTAVANRYREDPHRGAKRRKARPTAAAGGSLTPHPVTSHPENTSYVTFTISDSDDLNILLNGGAPSDSDEQ
jgi:hypothetical protein